MVAAGRVRCGPVAARCRCRVRRVPRPASRPAGRLPARRPGRGDGQVLVGHVLGEEAAALVRPQLGVVAAQRDQLGVRALLDDAALLEHDQPVHARDRAQPVRDGDHRLAFHQAQQLVLDGDFDLAVQRRGGFVEHQDRRVLQDHARDGDALALAAAELDAAFAHMRVVAGAALPVLQAEDELVRLRLLRRGHDLCHRGAGPAVADVGGDRAVQQRGVLRDHADRARAGSPA